MIDSNSDLFKDYHGIRPVGKIYGYSLFKYVAKLRNWSLKFEMSGWMPQGNAIDEFDY